MTCAHCVNADANPWHGRFDDACKGCIARRLALSPAAYRAAHGEPEDLQADIAALWKEDYEAGRASVWRWMAAIRAAKPSIEGDRSE